MIGWILYRKSAHELNWHEDHAVLRLIEASEAKRMHLRVFRPEDLSFTLSQGSIDFTYLGMPISQPHFALPRRGASTTQPCMLLLHALRASGTVLINTPEAIALAQDKLLSAIYLAAASLPIPKTQWLNSPYALNAAQRSFDFPVIVKKSIGKRGSAVIKCPDVHFLEDTFQMIGPSTSPVLVQDFVTLSHGRDLRVLVLGGKAVACMQRTAAKGGYKANYSTGGSVSPFPLTESVRLISEEAARTLGLDVAGVDLLFTEATDQFLVCEVNSSPGFKGLEEACGKNIAQLMIDFILRKVHPPASAHADQQAAA